MLLIERNDSRQLEIKRNMDSAVHSSMIERSLSFNALSDINTTKQRPNRLDDVLSMCGDLLSSDIGWYCSIKLGLNYCGVC